MLSFYLSIAMQSSNPTARTQRCSFPSSAWRALTVYCVLPSTSGMRTDGSPRWPYYWSGTSLKSTLNRERSGNSARKE